MSEALEKARAGAAALAAARRAAGDSARRASAFAAWFGASRIVDEDGAPMVMYHGSYKDFAAFDRMASAWRGPSIDMVGSWFSSNPGDGGAGMYASGAGAAIYPVYLRVTRPRYFDSFREMLNAMHEAEGRDPAQHTNGKGSPEGLRELLKAQGYDGIALSQTNVGEQEDDLAQVLGAIKRAKYEEFAVPKAERAPYTAKRERLEGTAARLRAELAIYSGSTEFDRQMVVIVFEPEQVKSAIGNSGAFDPSSASIIDSAEDALQVAREAHQALLRARDEAAAVDVPLNALGDFDETADGMKSLREAAGAFLRGLRDAGQAFDCPALNARVDVRQRGIKKVMAVSADRRKLALVPALAELFKTAVLVDSRPPYDGDVDKSAVAYHVLRAALRLGGEVLAVRIVVKEDGRGHFHYDHTVRDVGSIFDGAKENAPEDRGALSLLPMAAGRAVCRLASDQLGTIVTGDGQALNLFIEPTPLLDGLSAIERARTAATLAAKVKDFAAASDAPALERMRLARDIRELVVKLGGDASAPVPAEVRRLLAIARGEHDDAALPELYGLIQEAMGLLNDAGLADGAAAEAANAAITRWAELEEKTNV